MNRFRLSCAVAALLTGSLAAQQQINVYVPGFAWVVTPGSSLTSTAFPFGTYPDVITIGLVTQCGTSATPGGHTLANATFQGQTNNGSTVTGSAPTQIDQASDTYSHGSTAGSVRCNLNADADTAASGVSHTGPGGYNGTANASVTVACPAYSLTATCQASGAAGTPPLLMTVPQSGTFANGGQHYWFVSMDSRADANGTVPPGTSLNMVAACIAYGTVTLGN
jgi:hypothetical protein